MAWKSKLAPNTLYHRVGLLKKLMRALEKAGAPAIAEFLPKIRRPQARGVTATPEIISKLLAHAPTWQRLFITLAWQLALRFSETLEASPRNYNPGRHTLTIRTKGGKVRTIPVTQDVETLFAAAGDTQGREDEPYICLLRGRNMSKRGIRTAWWYLCDRAGVKGIHPHDLRRTTATNLYAACHDLRAVQQFLGHDCIASTTAYLAPLTEEQLHEMHRLLNFHARGKETIQ